VPRILQRKSVSESAGARSTNARLLSQLAGGIAAARQQLARVCLQDVVGGGGRVAVERIVLDDERIHQLHLRRRRHGLGNVVGAHPARQ
jgi:hypothetical protein